MSGTDELPIVRALRDMEQVADPQMRRVAATFIEVLAAQRDEAATLTTSLREALEPFASVGEALTAQSPTDQSPWATAPDDTPYGNQSLTFGDFRRAHNALNPSRKETGI